MLTGARTADVQHQTTPMSTRLLPPPPPPPPHAPTCRRVLSMRKALHCGSSMSRPYSARSREGTRRGSSSCSRRKVKQGVSSKATRRSICGPGGGGEQGQVGKGWEVMHSGTDELHALQCDFRSAAGQTMCGCVMDGLGSRKAWRLTMLLVFRRASNAWAHTPYP